MKTFHIILIILSMIVWGFTQVPTDIQPPASFRNQALGGVVDDDLDLVYDPIELHFVPGIRLYTNLSNLTSGKEQILNNLSDNEFLGGISWKHPLNLALNGAFLVRYQNAYFADSVLIDGDLDGYKETIGMGDVWNSFSGYYDTNGDGLYDLRKNIEQHQNNFDRQKHTAFILNHSLSWNKLVLGLRFTVDRSESESPRAGYAMGTQHGVLMGSSVGFPSFELHSRTYSIPDDFQQMDWQENGNFSSQHTFHWMDVHFSGMRPFVLPFTDTTEVRFDFDYFHNSRERKTDNNYSGTFAYYNHTLPDYRNDYQEQEGMDDGEKTSGGGMAFGISFKKVFQKASERKNHGFWQLYGGFRTAGYDYRSRYFHPFTSEEYFFDGEDTLEMDYQTTVDRSYSTTDEGDESHREYLFGARLNTPLGDRVFVGLGLGWRRFSVERTTNQAFSLTKEKSYQSFNATNSDDYQRTETYSRQADHTYRYSYTLIRVPVGIEYTFSKNKKWCLRFGSVFSYRREVVDDAVQITEAKPYVTIQKYGDGTEYVDVDDNRYQSTSRRTENSRSTTQFYYGLGYHPTDYLQIDLVSFLGTDKEITNFNPEFFRSLRLSLVVKL